jgi:hypothetical protein
MEGGNLMVAQLSDTDAALQLIHKGDLPDDMVEAISYKSAGYGIFCQGSRIAHAVSPVRKAKEARVSNVFSFQVGSSLSLSLSLIS